MSLSAFADPRSNNDEDEAKKTAARHRFENDLIAMQTDESKLLKKVEFAETDLRVMQKTYTDLGFAIKDKQEEVKKDQEKLRFLEEEIRIMKKKITNL
ncbi:MAG: hypothetical protein PHT88_00145 [Candidatus Moranbacteria bacterium]|nr:hypothetical protein [Candidatus Moranbacteria bacterium]